eukprot:4236683-Pleurochrysis_carterae.AAC.1
MAQHEAVRGAGGERAPAEELQLVVHSREELPAQTFKLVDRAMRPHLVAELQDPTSVLPRAHARARRGNRGGARACTQAVHARTREREDQ